MKRVKYIGGRAPKDSNVIWGGTIATNTAIAKAFEGDKEFHFEAMYRDDLGANLTIEDIKDFIKNADVVHADDTSVISFMLQNDIVPDVIGPIARSPIKDYVGWDCPYSDKVKQFYSAKVIRLNYAEEKDNEHLVTLIRHGVDLVGLQPSYSKKRKYILWAGDANRYAKNVDLFTEVSKMVLPEPYEWKLLSGYNVQDYWDILDETAILVNTSRYESFCAAMAEARAKGVPVIYKRGLHGPGVQEDGRIQVEYNAKAYQKAITELIHNPGRLNTEGRLSRMFISRFSLENMRDDIAKVYRSVL